ncbi:MAG: ADP-ribosylglycohydrolase family protein [Desulfatiglandaceae bacterium]
MDVPQDRAVGAILGTLIGDALGVGPHWYYDLDQMRKDYGEWIDQYTTPKPNRFHAGLKAGENSQTGQVVTFLLESIAQQGEYRESDFTGRLDALLDTLNGTPGSGRYTDHAMRDVWQARKKQGVDWTQAGSFADTAEAAIRTPVLAARYFTDFGKLIKCLQSNVLLTHRDPFIAGQSAAFGLIVAGVIDGYELGEVSQVVIRRAGRSNAPLVVTPPGFGEDTRVSFTDAVLQPSWSHAAAHHSGIQIEPAQSACRLFGLACTLGFMLPAAYYFAARFENDFYSSVMSAINGGGNNMARAALTGALAGAQVGLKGIPEYLIEGLSDHERLIDMAKGITSE